MIRRAPLLLTVFLFALALATALARNAGAALGERADRGMRERAALRRALGEGEAEVERLRAPSGLLARLRRFGVLAEGGRAPGAEE